MISHRGWFDISNQTPPLLAPVALAAMSQALHRPTRKKANMKATLPRPKMKKEKHLCPHQTQTKEKCRHFCPDQSTTLTNSTKTTTKESNIIRTPLLKTTTTVLHLRFIKMALVTTANQIARSNRTHQSGRKLTKTTKCFFTK